MLFDLLILGQLTLPDGQMSKAFRNPIRMTYGGITFKKCSAWTSNFLNLTDRDGGKMLTQTQTFKTKLAITVINNHMIKNCLQCHCKTQKRQPKSLEVMVWVKPSQLVSYSACIFHSKCVC